MTFIVVGLIILLGGSAALSLLFVSMKPEPPRRSETTLRRYVQADTVQYSDIKSPLWREGRVVSGSEVLLVAESSGKIEPGAVALRKGSSFQKGQLLATIYMDEAELALKARKSRFLTMITTLLPDLKVDYPDSYDSFRLFFDHIQMDQELPELPEVRSEQLKIFLASRNLFSEYYGIWQDEKRLSRHFLYAPFNGTFTRVNFEAGAYVNAGGQIAHMINTEQLEVEVPVENAQSHWIKMGDPVRVYSKNHEVLSGMVVRKSGFIDPATQAQSIFVSVKGFPGDDLLAGEYKEVEFPGQLIPQAMELPRNAVFNSNEVFTIVDGKLKKREIRVIKWNETTLIFDGLEEGTKIVAEPLINVKENTSVGIQGEENSANGNREMGSNQNSAARG